jgi:hypothetical protein
MSLLLALEYDSMFINDLRFVDSDPHDGVWDSGYTDRPTTAWDELYTSMLTPNTISQRQHRYLYYTFLSGAWIEIAHPAEYGLSGGLPMNRFFNDTLSSESEAYVVSVYHQIHCVVGLLSSLFLY